jgi:hypothetical protein
MLDEFYAELGYRIKELEIILDTFRDRGVSWDD